MKIGVIAPSRVPSNTANSIQVMKVCQALVQLGHTVKLWVPGQTTTPWEQLSGYYGVTTPFEISWLPLQPKLKRYDLALSGVNRAAGWQADLVYTWMPQAAVYGQIRGLPVVLEVHDRPTGKLGPWLLQRTIKMRGRKRLAVITRALVRVLEEEFDLPIPPENVVIAPDGVDLERYDSLPDAPSARAMIGLPPQQLTAVYTGHLYAGRGVELLLGLAQAFPQVHFLLVGGNPHSVENCRKQAALAGLINLTFTGFVENQRLALYQAAGDILLMPYGRMIAGSSGGNTADICSPMKMFEYMAAGRAILSSDLPVLREVLDETNAAFCAADELDSWKTGLQALLNDPARRQAIGMQAKMDAQGYSWKSRAEATLANLV
ncbi:MAG: glycosyltransferase family 4 protein [Bellilinea sp.]